MWKTTLLAGLISSLLAPLPQQTNLLKDISQYPQNINRYIQSDNSERDLVTEARQKKLAQNYLKHYFAPWSDRSALLSFTDIFNEEQNLIKEFQQHPGWNENQQRHSQTWITQLKNNMHLNTYPNLQIPGITIRPTSFRILPTVLPSFSDLKAAGEGYPFDNLQSETLPPNLPIYVLHTTHDGTWDLIMTPRGYGWVKSANIAYVTHKFMQAWQNANFVVATQDRQSLFNVHSIFKEQTRVGAFYPLVKTNKNSYRIHIALLKENGYAGIENSFIRKKDAAIFPFELTPAHIAYISNDFLGTPYGWGGLYGYRDCSSTLMDLFAPFGIWLPRVSGEQAYVGKFVSLKQISAREKKQFIMHNAIPFLTLVHKPGHIMLYIGNYHNQPMVFQDTWGLPTFSWDGKEGRAVVGKTVITPLNLGAHHADIPYTYLNLIDGITFLVPDAK